MANSYIQVATDGTGKKMQTVVNTVGADSVHAEVVTLADTSGAPITTLTVTDSTLATIETDGSQQTQIVDRFGDVVGSTSNAIDGNIKSLGGTAITVGAGNASTGTQRVVIATDQATVPVSIASVPSHAVTNAGTFAVQAAQSGTWTVQPGNTANTTAWKVDGSAVTQPTKEARASTPTQSSVANSATNVTLLSANANRLGATIFNDDTAGTGATLKLKLGATASATSFTVAIAPQGYYEVPFNYTGIIDGIASAGTGNARITELAA